jgi:hypothetical protein
LDAFLWDAIEHRLEALSSGRQRATLPGDKVLAARREKHAKRFSTMSDEAILRRASELQSAHDARVACGSWSNLDDFVARIVIRGQCQALRSFRANQARDSAL